MDYNDFFGTFDAKNFEIMAREYAKNNKTNINILQTKENNTKEFLETYENFLTILINVYKQKEQKNNVFFDDFFALSKPKLRDIISEFCKLYREVKCDYFFTHFACKIGTNFDIKKELKIGLEKLLFLAPKILQISQQKMLINLTFSIIKFL